MGYVDVDFSRLQEVLAEPVEQATGNRRGMLFDMRRQTGSQLEGVTQVESLVDALRTDRKPHLRRAETEAQALGETSFFRDEAVFEELRERVLPSLIERRQPWRRLRIWCAGCSTGQEAYSVAMLLSECRAELADWELQVLGTDLSAEAIAACRVGRYRLREGARGPQSPLLSRYLQPVGEMWMMSARVRKMCEFVQSDLRQEGQRTMASGRARLGRDCDERFDLVLLRNVLLYLAPEERAQVLEKVRSQMADDGVLLLGCGERAEDSTALFTVERMPGSYVYRPAICG